MSLLVDSIVILVTSVFQNFKVVRLSVWQLKERELGWLKHCVVLIEASLMFEEVSKGSRNVLIQLALWSALELASVKLSALQSDVYLSSVKLNVMSVVVCLAGHVGVIVAMVYSLLNEILLM